MPINTCPSVYIHNHLKDFGVIFRKRSLCTILCIPLSWLRNTFWNSILVTWENSDFNDCIIWTQHDIFIGLFLVFCHCEQYCRTHMGTCVHTHTSLCCIRSVSFLPNRFSGMGLLGEIGIASQQHPSPLLFLWCWRFNAKHAFSHWAKSSALLLMCGKCFASVSGIVIAQ